MKPVTLNRADYIDKVYGCWLGKNIGGTFGAPYEGRKERLNLSFYEPLPDKAAPNDDLDLQLVWLCMLEERGINPRLQDFADYWLKYLAPYPWDEYGYCLRNLSRGLRPPISGCFENDFIDQMGSPIRSEIWACIAPGNPQLAAEMAWKDAVLDHAGGEGIHGEMFFAALESAAFVENDPRTLIDIGLEMVPVHSAIHRSVKAALWCYDNGLSLDDARTRILRRFGHDHACNAPQNIGFTILGWLYGEDFGDKLCCAVNCGFDTDCTGATLGSIMGILYGASRLPAKWVEPVGDTIVLHAFTGKGLNAPKTVDELTQRTVALADKVIKDRSNTVEFGLKTQVAGNKLAGLRQSDRARRLLETDYESATVPVSDKVEATLHYYGEPVIYPNIPKLVGVQLHQDDCPISARIEMIPPKGWQVSLEGSRDNVALFCLTADNPKPSSIVKVRFQNDADRGEAAFIFLNADEATGVPPAESVAKCDKCWARIEACICSK